MQFSARLIILEMHLHWMKSKNDVASPMSLSGGKFQKKKMFAFRAEQMSLIFDNKQKRRDP